MHLIIKPNNIIKDVKKISKFKLFRTSIQYQLREYLNNSSLHGVRYIAESETSFCQRFMWFFFTVTCAIVACNIIFDLWHLFQVHPTIISLDQDDSNNEFNFPTVIVCPLNAYDTNRINEIAELFSKNDTNKIEFYKEKLQQLIKFNFNDNMNINLDSHLNETIHTEEFLNVFNERTLRSIIFDIAVHCNQTLKYCQFAGIEIDCCNNFVPVYSEHGFCYGFNVKYIDTNETRIRRNKFHKLYFEDEKWSFKIIPLLSSNIYISTIVDNLSGVYELFKLWKLNTFVDIILQRFQMYTVENTKQISIRKRGCIFSDEYKLDIFNDDIYTYPDCLMECQVMKSIELCQCIPPFYLQQKFTRYCNITQLECVRKYVENITDPDNCIHNCELNCIMDSFYTELLNVVSSHSSQGYVNIEFNKWSAMRYKREVLYDWIDLVVSFGGIGGLFLGFSFLSVIEIIYYFTMRAYFMITKDCDTLIAIENKRNLQIQKKYDLSLKPKKNFNHNKIQEVINSTFECNYAEKRIPIKYKKLDEARINKLQTLNSQQIQIVTPLTIINYQFRLQSTADSSIEYYGYLP